MRSLESLTVRGFLSIRDQTLNLARLNVLIGANGSGKSNLFQVFHLLRHIVSGRLQPYTGIKGGASRLLYQGTRPATALEIELTVRDDHRVGGYSLRLIPADDDTLVFDQETVTCHNTRESCTPVENPLGSGHTESRLEEADSRFSRWLQSELDRSLIHRFHNTGPTSRIRQPSSIANNQDLQHDGGNLGAFLYFLERNHPRCFKRIERAVHHIAPFFERFVLQPARLNPDIIQLEWKEIHHDGLFSAAALPDGLLRFVCLTTVLNQPKPPPLLILDEPEPGLHPAAVVYWAELLRERSQQCQILAATQSVNLINQLEPGDVWVVDRYDGESSFKHLAGESLEPWLESYAVGDLWEKNVIGGRP